ncbi:MAG: DUF2752 domain-containing protein [Roseburia sp.]
MVRKRLIRVLCVTSGVLLAGVLYGIFVSQTGIGIPCLIRLATGWKCPGCGVTHMCVALLHLDFAAAFAANPMMLLLSPVLALVFLKYTADYVKTGRWQMGRLQTGAVWVCIVLLILFGIVRNLVPL